MVTGRSRPGNRALIWPETKHEIASCLEKGCYACESVSVGCFLREVFLSSLEDKLQ